MMNGYELRPWAQLHLVVVLLDQKIEIWLGGFLFGEVSSACGGVWEEFLLVSLRK